VALDETAPVALLIVKLLPLLLHIAPVALSVPDVLKDHVGAFVPDVTEALAVPNTAVDPTLKFNPDIAMPVKLEP
jgi:hypothetical protein